MLDLLRISDTKRLGLWRIPDLKRFISTTLKKCNFQKNLNFTQKHIEDNYLFYFLSQFKYCYFFVTNWEFRCVHRYCFASEQLNLLKTKYFSERSLFVSGHSPFASADRLTHPTAVQGIMGFTGNLGMYEFFSILSLLRFFQHVKIAIINIIYGWNILPLLCKFIFLPIESILQLSY